MSTAPRSGVIAPAMPQIPERYRAQLQEARRVGYLSYRTAYGSGKLSDLWRAICAAERRCRIAIRDTDYGDATAIVSATDVGGFNPAIKIAVHSLLSEVSRVSWPSATHCAASGIPLALVPFIAGRLVRLAQYREVAK